MARSLAVLTLSTKPTTVTPFAQSVTAAMTHTPHVPSPPPSRATSRADVAALNTAETAPLSRTQGAVDMRSAKLAVVRSELDNLRACVQGVEFSLPLA